MRLIHKFSALLVTFVIPMSTLADDRKQKPSRFEARVKVEMDYLLYLPKDYETQKYWPLVLFLHGAGERGNNLELVKKHGPPKLIEAGKEFPFLVVSSQCPKNRWWEPIELTALLDNIVANHRIDVDRIYVTGLSMGGFGSWRLAAYSPHRFAAIVPICGGGEKYWARRFPHLAVWAFHGAEDTGVPLKRSKEMVSALEERGGHPKLTVYPNARHDFWTATYDDSKMYEWLLQQKRKPRPDK